MKWIPVEERLPDYDQYVTWKQADGMTFFADIDHDSSFDYLQKSCNAHALVNLRGIYPSEESAKEAKERVKITHWLDESDESHTEPQAGWTDEDMRNAFTGGYNYAAGGCEIDFDTWLSEYKQLK